MRWFVGAAIALWLTPVIAVGVHTVVPSPIAAIAAGLVLGAVAARFTAPRLAVTIAPAVRHPAVAGVVLVLAVAAVAQVARVSIYMADPSRTDCSYLASDPWRSRHACMTAYFEAMRFSADPGTNIYEMSLYEPRTIGPLKVDSFHYPPPFLLLPAAVHAVHPTLFEFRAVWFTMQGVVLAAVVFGLAVWIGGTPGAAVAAGGVLLLASPQALYSLQQGNIQTTALPVAAAAFVLLWMGRLAAGAPLLAYVAAAKIFPGILVVYLAAARRWRALAATSIAGAAVVALTLGIFGMRPFEDFVRHELPRISNGAAFPQSDQPHGINPNMSVYGLTVRARAFGVRALDQPRGLAIASVFGILVIALAAALGWRQRPDMSQPFDRLRLVQIAVAVLMLASFRSPFVGFYGLLAAVWLMTLAAANARSTGTLLLSWLAIAVFSIAHVFVPSPAMPWTTGHLVLSTLVFCTALATGVGVAVAGLRTTDAVRAATIQAAGAGVPSARS
jgi:hypothetical protein